MKIVIDTNVVLAALMAKKGISNKFMIWLFENPEKINVVSNTLVTEFEDVLLREKNRKLYEHFSKDDLHSFIDDICLISHHQKINFLWRPFLKDIKDDMVLETAFNAGSEYIITYNTKDFVGVEDKFSIKIITPKEFLKITGVLT
ncbi:putative toxin-antitoxin system toxin component, PIN family [Sulfurimonas paralvinellae]|uniref:Putative toxin-antitoxin system toxin component, PIN family n=1 Tax=Sulfurimonas paralvinellae TaxID=317658 RepID=A0A7M1BAX3_9BACT|nr:putative toxin-antitoxin system toxin component, PIN family [Sulfurimonas paralvinellae]QOP46781.1 putative toxin-antitoxin system toxin component, PIN family [Sulfurimonas paralvinellae]